MSKSRPDQEFAALALDSLDTSDPEEAHGNADAILLANAHPSVAAAYQRVVDRCNWWATA